MQEYFVYIAGSASGVVVQLLTACVSLRSIVIAATALFHTAKTAKRQAADNLSAKRQIWIEDLQKDAARYLALLARREELRRPNPELTGTEQKQTMDERRDVELKASEDGIRIKLRLNPTDTDHQTLERLFEDLARACTPPPANETPEQMRAASEQFHKRQNAIILQFQKIFEQEWERIKTGALIGPMPRYVLPINTSPLSL